MKTGNQLQGRPLQFSQQQNINAETVSTAIFIEAQFPSETIRISTETRDIMLNGNNYIGAGALISIEAVSETLDTKSTGVSLTMNGLDTNLLMKFLEDEYQGKEVNSWIVFLDANRNPIGDPIVYFRGQLDTDSIQIGADTSSITVSAESQLSNILVARGYRYTAEDQRILLGKDEDGNQIIDRGFDYVSSMRNYEFYWGAPGVSPQ